MPANCDASSRPATPRLSPVAVVRRIHVTCHASTAPIRIDEPPADAVHLSSFLDVFVPTRLRPDVSRRLWRGAVGPGASEPKDHPWVSWRPSRVAPTRSSHRPGALPTGCPRRVPWSGLFGRRSAVADSGFRQLQRKTLVATHFRCGRSSVRLHPHPPLENCFTSSMTLSKSCAPRSPYGSVRLARCSTSPSPEQCKAVFFPPG